VSRASDQVEQFEREGLLDGLDGRDREGRVALLRELTKEGYSL
jgi:hypothetical protein